MKEPTSMPVDDTVPPDSGELRRILSAPLRIDEFRPLSSMVTVAVGAHSRAGLRRTANEDHFVVMRLGRHQEVLKTSLPVADVPKRFDEYGYAMVVADGVGPAGSGALASRVAIGTLAHLAIHFGKWNLRIDAGTAESVMERAAWFYERAARAVDHRSRNVPEFAGMATSLTAAISAGDEMFYAHVGNSRAYVFRAGELTQITRDHTLDQRVAESGRPVPVPPGSRCLSEVLTDLVGGGRGLPAVDVERFRLFDHDVILLCTKGLYEVVNDDAMAHVLAQVRDPNDQCRRLTELAVEQGAAEDATALIARYSIPAIADDFRPVGT
jgi:protein phosphatase